jgi:hypothetical protein
MEDVIISTVKEIGPDRESTKQGKWSILKILNF